MTTKSASPKTVLLVAGPGAENARLALAQGGYVVRESGWLDAVTAARVERPDAVVIAGELPRGAAEMLVRAFGSQDVYAVPLVLAGVPDELRVEPSLLLKVRAVAKPADPGAVLAAVEHATGNPIPVVHPLSRAWLSANLDTPARRVRFAFGAIVCGSSVVDGVAKALLSPTNANRAWGTTIGVAALGWGLLAYRDLRSRRWRALHVMAMLVGVALFALLAFDLAGS
jgi:hypothetical protein